MLAMEVPVAAQHVFTLPLGSCLGRPPNVLSRWEPYSWPGDAPLRRAFSVLIIVPQPSY
jgi:hypothetical protein